MLILTGKPLFVATEPTSQAKNQHQIWYGSIKGDFLSHFYQFSIVYGGEGGGYQKYCIKRW